MRPRQHILQHKFNKKTNAKFVRLLQRPAWKRNGSIVEGIDKSGSKQVRKKV